MHINLVVTLPLLDAFTAEQQSFTWVLPRKGLLDAQASGMERYLS
jgi:hypothetical protein